jgi:hypothetical protein
MCAAAVQLACLPALQQLLRLPAVQQLDRRDAAALIRWAICTNTNTRSSDAGIVDMRCLDRILARAWQPKAPGCTAARAEALAAVSKLPAAQRIGRCSLVGLLVRAMQQGNVEAVQQLCKLSAANALDLDCIRGLLRWARVVGSRPGRDAVVGALCELRGAEGLSLSDSNELLLLYDRIDDMMGWNAAESVEEGVEPAEGWSAECASGQEWGPWWLFACMLQQLQQVRLTY